MKRVISAGRIRSFSGGLTTVRCEYLDAEGAHHIHAQVRLHSKLCDDFHYWQDPETGKWEIYRQDPPDNSLAR